MMYADESSFTESLDRMKESFLWAAAQGGNSQDCDALIEIGADINWRGPGGDTALIAACRRGHIDTAEILIAHGADVNLSAEDSLAPLHIVCRRGDMNMLNLLLGTNVNKSAKTSQDQTPLDIAKSKGFEDLCARLSFGDGAPNAGRRGSVRQELQLDMGTDRRPSQYLANANSNHTEIVSGGGGGVGRMRSTSIKTSIGPSETGSDEGSVDHDYVAEYNRAMEESMKEYHLLSPGNLRSNSNDNESLSSSLQGSQSQPQPQPQPQPTSQGGLPSPRPSSAARRPSTLQPLHGQGGAAFKSDHSNYSGHSNQYSLIGNERNIQSQDETVRALQKTLDTEINERRLLDSKMILLKDQNVFLASELSNVRKEMGILSAERNQYKEAFARLNGEAKAINKLDLAECEELEKELRHTLDVVETRKAVAVKEHMDKQAEQRMCVVCTTKEKSVVLLPCRHMCLCDDCSKHEQLELCPLCRRPIAHKISVFA
jgi:hypothetical protein